MITEWHQTKPNQLPINHKDYNFLEAQEIKIFYFILNIFNEIIMLEYRVADH